MRSGLLKLLLLSFFISVVINYSCSTAYITVGIVIVCVLVIRYITTLATHITLAVTSIIKGVFGFTCEVTVVTIRIAFIAERMCDLFTNVSAALYVTGCVARVAIFVRCCTSVLTALNVTIIIAIVAELVYNIS